MTFTIWTNPGYIPSDVLLGGIEQQVIGTYVDNNNICLNTDEWRYDVMIQLLTLVVLLKKQK